MIPGFRIENKSLKNQLSTFQEKEVASIKKQLIADVKKSNGIHVVVSHLGTIEEKDAKTLSFQLEKELGNAWLLFGFIQNSKPMLMLHISPDLVATKSMNAIQTIKTLAAHIQGGGGGQPFFATAGGKNAEGLEKALDEGRKLMGFLSDSRHVFLFWNLFCNVVGNTIS